MHVCVLLCGVCVVHVCGLLCMYVAHMCVCVVHVCGACICVCGACMCGVPVVAVHVCVCMWFLRWGVHACVCMCVCGSCGGGECMYVFLCVRCAGACVRTCLWRPEVSSGVVSDVILHLGF